MQYIYTFVYFFYSYKLFYKNIRTICHSVNLIDFINNQLQDYYAFKGNSLDVISYDIVIDSYVKNCEFELESKVEYILTQENQTIPFNHKNLLSLLAVVLYESSWESNIQFKLESHKMYYTGERKNLFYEKNFEKILLSFIESKYSEKVIS